MQTKGLPLAIDFFCLLTIIPERSIWGKGKEQKKAEIDFTSA